MPLLPRVFGKRDKSSTNLQVPGTNRKASVGSGKSSEYVLPDLDTPPDFNGSEFGHSAPSSSKQSSSYSNKTGTASSSRQKSTMPGFKRKQTAPENGPSSPRSSASVRGSLEPPPSRTSVFAAFGRSGSSQSLPDANYKSSYAAPQLPPIDLPDQPLYRRPGAVKMSTLPVPKTPEMRTSNTVKIFNWGSKPSRISDAPKLDLQIPSSSTQDPLDSFNLKSFRPVRPVSPSNELDMKLPPAFLDQPRSQSPATLAPPSPIGGSPRPRGSSFGSENSQKITVAQFRQAQLESAKNRSSVHLPVPEHPSDSMPPGNVPLHVARPVSPSFAMAAATNAANANASGNESGGEAGTPSRPGRLVPPQAMGRSSPIPRERTPVSASPRVRPQSSARPLENARLSAKWMVESDSDTNSSEDTASDDASRWPSKKLPLISDFRKLKGANSPKPESSTPSHPSSFASSPKNKLGTSASKSDLGHDSSSTARQHAPPRSPASLSISTPPRPHSSFALSSSPVQNIKPGQYSGSPTPTPVSPPLRSSSVMTHGTGESVDVWSNTHSAAHSRQGSSDQLFKQGQKGVTQTDLGHGGSVIKRAAGIRRAGTADSLAVPGPTPVVTCARSQSANVVTQPTPSSFSAAKANPRTAAPVATDTEDDEHPSSTEDDTPLSTLVPPRRPGSNLSNHGSGSPVNSTTTLPLRDQSPARSARSTMTHKSRSSFGTIAPILVSRTKTPEPRQDSTNSRSPSSKEQTPELKSPLSRGRKPLIDLDSSEPTLVTAPSRSSASPQPTNINQTSLLTPPISEQGFSSANETVRRQSPAIKPSSFMRPAPSAIQRSHDRIARPFTREDSPASSVGNSSVGSGLYPNTPGTGSDAGMSMRNSQSIVTSSSGSSGNEKPLERSGKRLSITFDDTVVFTQKKSLHHRRGASGSSTGSGTNTEDQDIRRNERRRSEARASIELGHVVNGPPPVLPDDDAQDSRALHFIGQSQAQNWNPWQTVSQQQQMQAMGMNMGPTTPGMGPMNMMFNPMMSQMQMNMGGMMNSQPMFNIPPVGMPMGYNMPPGPPMPNMMMGMDPSMMVAHQQAMAVAKQAYQMAVAQQAMAAAGDEWERSSNMGGYGGASRPPTLFGMPSGSLYGGGSMLGVNGPTGGSHWGGSVYGEAFGPSAQQQQDWRQQGMGAHSVMGVDDEQLRGQGRKRTLTAPSSALPPAHLRGAGAPPMPPPSSWRPS